MKTIDTGGDLDGETGIPRRWGRPAYAWESDLGPLRIGAGYSLNSLAALVGTTPETIRNIENAKHVPNAILAVKIARVLGCGVENIVRPQ